MNAVTTAEVIRLFLFPLLGAVLMFVLQPILYSTQIVRLTDVKPQLWIDNHYFPCAIIVFACGIFTALAWCILAIKSPPNGIAASKQRATLWWLLGTIPIVSIGLAIILSRMGIIAPKGSEEATISLVCLFFVDVLWLYWLTTATTTPGLASAIPPGARLFRR
jgi:hypothetical protein